MQLNNIQRRTKNKKRPAVGRGGKRGKTSGRGTKGQKARAGRKLRPELRDIIKRLPKMRGRGKNIFNTIQTKPMVVNLRVLDFRFKNGESVSPETLVEKGIIKKIKGIFPQVKILGDGELTKPLVLTSCYVSLPAKLKIEKVGGTIS